MTQTQHTPGHWSVGSLPPAEWRYIMSEDGGDIAAVAEWDENGNIIRHMRTETEAKATARLIAAAPQLLDSLQAMVTWALQSIAAGDETDAILPRGFDKARAAIKAATEG